MLANLSCKDCPADQGRLHPGREIMLCGSGQIWTGIESYKIVFCKLELAKLAEDLLKAIRWSKSQAQSRTTDWDGPLTSVDEKQLIRADKI